ncbi:MAG: glycosyltransferase family 2 protein [Thermoplasmata archaeon]|nr:glycosyltransferase family 2 protein [Thermoplasmata archaeon]
MISIIVPVFNEEENIFPLYQEIKDAMGKEEYEIIFIDDGSTDSTYEKIKEIHDEDRRVKCIKFTRNFGKTAALMAGFEEAKGDSIITMDGDLQNDPSDIPSMIKMLEEYDAVNGWRYSRKDPFISKKLPSRISNIISRWATGLKLHDFNCGLKAYRKEVIRNLELFGEMHRYIPAIIAWKGYKVGEMKVKHRPRKYGKSKYGVIRLFRGLFDLLNFKFWAGYSTRPLHFFGGVGLATFGAGFLIDFYLLMLKILYGELLSNRPLLILGVLLMVIGIQIFLTGFMAEIMIRSYYTSGNKKFYVIREKIE